VITYNFDVTAVFLELIAPNCGAISAFSL
jgi:hypothetical protein